MLTYDPATNLRHYPAAMGRFGQNPYGENLYRIVFAPSRMSLVCGTFHDGSTGAKWLPQYGHLGDVWVLEKWLDPWSFSRMTRERWDREMSVLGPYPDRGEYELCHVFETCDPVQANLDKLISWIEEGKTRSWQEVRDACDAKYQSEEKASGDLVYETIREKLPAFGVAPMSGYGGGRGSKTAALLRSAQEAGMPGRGGLSAG